MPSSGRRSVSTNAEGETICTRCDLPTGDCECHICEGCRTAHRCAGDSYCHDCDRCSDCCGCYREDEPEERDEGSNRNGVVFHTARPFFWGMRNSRDNIVNKSNRYVSVEIEIAGINREGYAYQINDARSTWNAGIVEDGSLPATGFEINTAPAAGDAYSRQIADFAEALGNARAFVTTDCGLHVHADARDFRWYDIRKLIFLYERLERQLFSIVPRSRRDNHYCKACGGRFARAIRRGRLPKAKEARKDLKKRLLKAIYDPNETRIEEDGPITTRHTRTWRPDTHGKRFGREGQRYTEARYSALNVHSWIYRGTVELRLPNGTANQQALTNWGRLWSGFLDAANRMPEREILQVTDLTQCYPNQRDLHKWIEKRRERFASADAPLLDDPNDDYDNANEA